MFNEDNEDDMNIQHSSKTYEWNIQSRPIANISNGGSPYENKVKEIIETMGAKWLLHPKRMPSTMLRSKIHKGENTNA